MPYAASKPIKIETLELDEPQQGEVLVKMKAASSVLKSKFINF
ncbi:Alcohol dehydrogenase [Heyndrickxia coagulans]|nr:Alcohol dehydrogenase [Heyndrickxia coagulans]